MFLYNVLRASIITFGLFLAFNKEYRKYLIFYIPFFVGMFFNFAGFVAFILGVVYEQLHEHFFGK